MNNSLVNELTVLLANDSGDAASKIDALMIVMFYVAGDTIKNRSEDERKYAMTYLRNMFEHIHKHTTNKLGIAP